MCWAVHTGRDTGRRQWLNSRPLHQEPPPSKKASFTWSAGLQTERRPHAEDSSHAPQLCFRSSFLPCTAPVALCSEHRGSHVTLTWGRSPPKPHTGVGGRPQAGFPSRPGGLGARASTAWGPLPAACREWCMESVATASPAPWPLPVCGSSIATLRGVPVGFSRQRLSSLCLLCSLCSTAALLRSRSISFL